MAEGSNYDYLFKVDWFGFVMLKDIVHVIIQVVLIGDSGVGKSYVVSCCLFSRSFTEFFKKKLYAL